MLSAWEDLLLNVARTLQNRREAGVLTGGDKMSDRNLLFERRRRELKVAPAAPVAR